MSFYFRHFAGFLIQTGGGMLLCWLPFKEGAFFYPRRQVMVGSGMLAVLFSALFPLTLGMGGLASASYRLLFVNLYMLLAFLVFMFLYFWTIQEEVARKIFVLVLAMFYMATQYLLVNLVTPQSPGTVLTEIYSPVKLALYGGTAAILFPPWALFMRWVVRRYLAEMETGAIRRVFGPLFVAALLYFAILAAYASRPEELLPDFWWWLIPPLLLAIVVLGIFCLILFQESVCRKCDSEESRTRELQRLQKLQYENIIREMERDHRRSLDMCRSLEHLSDLLVQGDEKAVKTYLSELTEQVSRQEETSYCKNATVNGLLQYYVGLAENSGIRCEVQADCGEVPVASEDLTILLGNMMKNAICACEKEENRWITVEIGAVGGSLLIMTQNPCQGLHPSGKYYVSGGFLPAAAFVRSRSGGYGLFSMENTAGKYGGKARFRFDEQTKIFTARVQMNLYRGK